MSAKASPTAAAAPQERREQPPAALAIANASMANAIRALAMDAVEQAKSGHPGMPMGMADVATVLFSRFLKFDPADPAWPDRDRFVLSAGHGSMLLYALLHLTGYEAMTIDEIKTLPPARFNHRRPSGISAMRPASRPPPDRSGRAWPTPSAWRSPRGISPPSSATASSTTTPMCIASDGDLMEGISQEAIALAGHLKLNKLIVLFDDNGISIDGALSLVRLRRSGEALRSRRLERRAYRRPRSGGD